MPHAAAAPRLAEGPAALAQGAVPAVAGDGTRARHVAIIMDGNGRWATRRGLPRLAGHKAGADAVRGVVEASPELGVSHLTLYAFSTENWKRSVEEVRGLMNLFRIYVRKEGRELQRRGARVRFIGERTRLDPDIRRMMVRLEEATADNDKLHLTVALNYGGRDELVAAMRRLAAEVAAGRLAPEAIDAAAVDGALWTRGLPDPDLVIRTSGEMRTSNFLPWQSTYAEYVFVEDCWPDFTRERYAQVLEAFAGRRRRFGAAP